MNKKTIKIVHLAGAIAPRWLVIGVTVTGSLYPSDNPATLGRKPNQKK